MKLLLTVFLHNKIAYHTISPFWQLHVLSSQTLLNPWTAYFDHPGLQTWNIWHKHMFASKIRLYTNYNNNVLNYKWLIGNFVVISMHFHNTISIIGIYFEWHMFIPFIDVFHIRHCYLSNHSVLLAGSQIMKWVQDDFQQMLEHQRNIYEYWVSGDSQVLQAILYPRSWKMGVGSGIVNTLWGRAQLVW